MNADRDFRSRSVAPGSDTLSHPDDEAMQGTALIKLRWAAVAGQLLVIGVVALAFEIALPLLPLLSGVAALVLFNLVAMAWAWRGHRLPVLAALVIDLVLLSWQLYWSGGPANPFVSLFVVPIALAATWRSARSVLVTAVLAIAAYSMLWFQHRPLPHVHGEFDLHLFGMWVNFLLTALAVGFFGVRVASTMARQREALRVARERSLRDEGVLAVATLAAGAAHALNTPLSTMAVVLADLRDGWPEAAAEVRQDLAVLAVQLDACRDAVRQLVAEAQPQASGRSQPLALRVDQAVTRWRLLRPAFALNLSIAESAAAIAIDIDQGFDHLLINLLNNAADAAEANARHDVALDVGADVRFCVIEVHDPGSGFASAQSPFASTKPDGMGLGLALAAMICERHGGELAIHSGPGGTRVRATLALPRPAIAA